MGPEFNISGLQNWRIMQIMVLAQYLKKLKQYPALIVTLSPLKEKTHFSDR